MNHPTLARKLAVTAMATLIAFAGLAPFAPGASADANYEQVRYSGTDRFDTASLIASAVAEATPTAVLARADIYPDALTGAFAAAAHGDGPLLLTRREAVPTRTMQALQDENVDNVILLGGTAAISGTVENQLTAAGYSVRRIFGATRYQTAIRIAEDGAGIIGTIDGDRSALLSSGENFPDALAGAPLSFAAGLPSLLTPSNLGDAGRVALFNQVVDAMNRLGIRHVFLLGGPAAVSQGVEDSLRNAGFGTTRLAGGNRSATSVEVFEFGLDKDIYTNRRFGLARGDTFPDALAYAPLGGRPRATVAPQSGAVDTGGSANGLLLAASHCTLSDAVESFLIQHQSTWTEGEILGGPAAICADVAEQVRQAASFGRAAITLDSTTTTPGGTIPGNVAGEGIATVTVQGCGLVGPQTVNRDAQGDFTVTIPSSQTTDCTLTFTTTFTDGTQEIDQFAIDITAPAGPDVTLSPTSGPSGSTVTATYSGNRPANITDVSSTNCTVTNEGTQSNNRTFTITGTEGQNCTVVTTVQFTDTQGGTATFTDTFTVTAAAGSGQGVGAGPQLSTAGPDLLSVTIVNGAPNDAIANQVRFTYDEAVLSPGANNSGGIAGSFSIQGADSDAVLNATGAAIDSSDAKSVIAQFPDTTDLRTFTIGTSDEGAVTDGTNLSVMASKPLGGSVTIGGRTAAPDLIGVTPNITSQEVTYCFDQPVHNTFVEATRFGYYTDSGAESRGDSFTALSGTQSCVTVQFGGIEPNGAANSDQLVEAGDRFFVEDETPFTGDSAVRDASGTRDNPLGHEPQDATTVRPDLTSATKVAGQPSQVDYTFDEPVTASTAVATEFAVYQDDGTRFEGDAVTQNGTNTVRVTFFAPLNELNQNNIGQIVLAAVEEDAVFSASNASSANTVGDAPLAAGTTAQAGFTDGPDLIGATFNTTTNQVTYQFDESVQDATGTATSVNPNAFFVVDAAGVESCGTGTATVSGTNVTINFAAGVASAAGAGVNSDTDGEGPQAPLGGTGCTLAHGAFDFAGNGNSPDSVGGGPAPSTS